MKEKISVIMSVYKESKNELEASIKSILNQTYKNIEYIIVLDNPDEKWRIDYLKNIDDKRVKLIINKSNFGLPKSLNIALKNSTGKYIARMDADDISKPNRLERQLQFLIENNYDMCGCFVSCFIEAEDFQYIKFPIEFKNVKKLVYLKNCISHPTYFLKKEVYDQLGGYHNIFSCEDYDFLLRVIDRGFVVGNVPEFLLRYRISPNSISRSNAGHQELIAIYLKNFYKNNTNKEVTEKMIQEYLELKEFKNRLKSYDYYWGMKNTRSKFKENKFPKYYIYSLLLILNFKHSSKEIWRKIYEKKILSNEVIKNDL